MATCFVCNQAAEQSIDMPCCGIKCHSLCAIENVAQQAYSNGAVNCVCGHVLFSNPYAHTYSSVTTEATVEELLTRDGIEEEIKANKVKFTRLRGAITGFHRVVQSKMGDYKAAVAPHIAAIKGIQEIITGAIKQTPEYKEARSSLASFHLTQARFMKKHNITNYMFSMLHNIRRRWRLHWYTPVRFIKRKFRIRI
jgi:hypothetical protein